VLISVPGVRNNTMIIFIYGQDTYRLGQKLKEIVVKYQQIHSGLNFKHFDVEDKSAGFQDFTDEFQQTSMFKEKKLIVLKNIFLSSDFQDKFLKKINDFLDSEDIIIVCEKNKITASNRLFKALKKKTKNQEFNLLKGKELEKWVQGEFSKYDLKIEAAALERIIEFVGDDLWRLSGEIQKLVNYRGKESDSKIKAEEVDLLVRPKVDPDIFKTIGFMASKNKKEALKLIKKHRERGDAPLYLLSMICFQFRNLLIIRELIEKNTPYYLIAKKTGLHPYVVKKTYPQAEKFSLAELKKIYQKIFDVDLAIKKGKTDPEAAIDFLIAEI